ncbi:beta-alanine-activating enzyme isoform X4 [Scaptodrosophila lebanonensis]|uniref:Beta-alanine-activating enzyme isoform X4 n=1 Tax=Drosophila lebanonensis TaxID=7225 RepID=A0A6J2TWM0_DROLE|nr:beta-alanine-activating enzyme isoform X4 [Scaptodrosophila lebanonensis]
MESHRSTENSDDPRAGAVELARTEKLYDLERLLTFGDVPFIIKRVEPEDFTVSYSEVVSNIKMLLLTLRNQVPSGTGIAFRISHHTPSSCILILAILNHKCHFFATDKMILSKKLKVQLCRAGIDFLIVCGHMIMGSEYFELKDTFLILNEEYKLFKLKRGDAEDQNLISLPANMCYTITTTGTTNEPKLIHVPYDCIAPNILALSKKLNVSMADIIYLGTPCTFDPFVVEFFLALQNGAAVFLSPYSMRESPTRLLEALLPLNVTAPGITILQATPSLFRMFGAAAIRDRILNTGTTLRWRTFPMLRGTQKLDGL